MKNVIIPEKQETACRETLHCINGLFLVYIQYRITVYTPNYRNLSMIHQLCSKCVHKCKQDSKVKIVKCPNFQKRLSDDEFGDLVDKLKEMESETANLKKRTRHLIDMALNGQQEENHPATMDDDENNGTEDDTREQR